MNILKPLAAMAIFMAALCDPVSAQANDSFANRTVIASAGGTVSGSNFNATEEVGEPNHAGEAGGRSVWWTWTPAISGTAEISSVGSDFDTVLGVYTGTSVVGGLTERASNDDGGAVGPSLARLSVTAGTAYHIAVDSYRAGGGSIRLTITFTDYISSTKLTTYEITKFDVMRGELTFTELPGAISYQVQWSKTLIPGSWNSGAPGGQRIEATGAGERIVKIGIIDPACYYRVIAELAPQGFVLIPGGTFQMGDMFGERDFHGGGNVDERPVHSVNVSAFLLQARETTKGEWDEVRTWALFNGYTFDNPGSGKAADHPVKSVSWYDVVKWCNARSEKEGLVPCYYTNAARTQVYKTKAVDVAHDQVLWTANGYRLPTEAEWEKAARGGLKGKRFPWGDTITHALANYFSIDTYYYDISLTRAYHPAYGSGDLSDSSPVGSFASNGYGLYDMTGNVLEWCWDWYGSYAAGAQTDPKGSITGSARVYRGGAWADHAFDGRVSFRGRYTPSIRAYYAGFRLARGR